MDSCLFKIFSLIIVLGILLSPSLTSDIQASQEVAYSDSAVNRAALIGPSKLKKLRYSLDPASGKVNSTANSSVVSDRSSEESRGDESESDGSRFEIKRLDKVFGGYVMSRFFRK